MKPDRHTFGERIGKQAARKRRARRARDGSIWLGLGMFGLVGWSVAVPTLLGLALGRWIDATWPSHISWTLTLLLVGVLAGCLNAWHWVAQERRTIERRHNEAEEHDDA
jgi:ATP synthase protein I